MKRAWSLLTISGARQYGGNTGYDDDPIAAYRYDSDVANHRQIKVGDIVFIRSRSDVLGLAEIESIFEGTGQKERLRCPHCHATNIKRRLTKSPPWGCKNGHVFEEPLNDLSIEIPAALKAELVTRDGVRTAEGAHVVEEQVSAAEIEQLARVSAVPSQTWFDLAAWAMDTQSLQPWQRSLSFSLGRAAGNGKAPTRKQAEQGEKILAEARSLGFKG